MTFYGVVALAEFSIALTFRYNKVLFVSERVFWMTFYGVVALAEFSIALKFRYNKVLFVSERCLHYVGIKRFLGEVSDCYRFLDF